jgi:hypothetical protein
MWNINLDWLNHWHGSAGKTALQRFLVFNLLIFAAGLILGPGTDLP